MGRVLYGLRTKVAGLMFRSMKKSDSGHKSMTGLKFEKHPDWFDALFDGTVIGTVHLVNGGWVFYAAGKGRVQGSLPAGVGTSRENAVWSGLTAGKTFTGANTKKALM